MKSSEIIERLNNYILSCDGKIESHGRIELKYSTIQSYLENLIEYDSPDAYSVVGDAVCVIEHFEFDSTESTKKGSESRRVVAGIDRNFDKVEPTAEGVTLRDYSYNAHHKTRYYINNALQNIKYHYSKIDSYKNNLKREGVLNETTKLEIGFFIEDATILGNVYDPGEWQPARPLFLSQCKQFLDVFEEELTDLDFCICVSQYNSKSYMWFINRESVAEYRKHQIDLDDVEIINFQPKVIGFKIIVPDDERKSDNNI